MAQLTTGVEVTFPRGEWLYVATITTGPIVMNVKTKKDGAVFQPMTDGSFSASGDGVIKLSSDLIYSATIPSGDFLDISLSSTGT
jgi:hypothetical protein